jgi:hypothetical protein
LVGLIHTSHTHTPQEHRSLITHPDTTKTHTHTFTHSHSKQLTAFRMTTLAWALAALSGKGKEPLERWLASVRSAVRDEKYLVRLELVDYGVTAATEATEG